jgi:putative DNA primase/helicase
VEFNRVFQEDEQDKHLKRTLAGELPGILTLALTAYAGVIQRGHFTIPESCVKAKDQWRIEADQVAQFKQDCCTTDPEASVQSGTLYRAYLAWADGAGIKRTLNRPNFSKRIQHLGAKPGRTADSRFFTGITLRG